MSSPRSATACDKDHAVNLTIAELNARLDDVAAEAAAAAQLKARNPAGAAQTLAPLLTRAPIATYARVATEPALAPLTRRPELAKLRVTPAGTVKLAVGKADVTMTGKGKTQIALAVSTRHRLVATIDGPRSRGNCAGDADLLLLDQTGGEVTRVPLYTVAEMSPESGGCPFARPARPKITARAAAAQRLLADLGFFPAAGETGTVVTGAPVPPVPPGARFPRAQLQLMVGPERVTVLRGSDELGGAANPGANRIDAATYVPELAVVVLRWRGEQESCAAVDRGDPGDPPSALPDVPRLRRRARSRSSRRPPRASSAR